jgi:hypothetical protein
MTPNTLSSILLIISSGLMIVSGLFIRSALKHLDRYEDLLRKQEENLNSR